MIPNEMNKSLKAKEHILRVLKHRLTNEESQWVQVSQELSEQEKCLMKCVMNCDNTTTAEDTTTAAMAMSNNESFSTDIKQLLTSSTATTSTMVIPNATVADSDEENHESAATTTTTTSTTHPIPSHRTIKSFGPTSPISKRMLDQMTGTVMNIDFLSMCTNELTQLNNIAERWSNVLGNRLRLTSTGDNGGAMFGDSGVESMDTSHQMNLLYGFSNPKQLLHDMQNDSSQ